LYEIKTFVKPKEKLIIKTALDSIFRDFKKLANNKYGDVRCYFILICKKKDYDSIENEECYRWFNIRRDSNRREYRFEEDKYKIRPSSKAIISNTYVYSWEIIKLKC